MTQSILLPFIRVGHVQVKDFVEQAVDQCTLSENEYYRRISYSFQTSTIEVRPALRFELLGSPSSDF